MLSSRQYLNIKKDGQTKNCGFINWKTHSYISKRVPEHIFKKWNGFGCSAIILNYLREKGIETIIIVFQGRFLKATVTDFYEKGNLHRDGTDIQKILRISDFKKAENMTEKQMEL